MSTASPLDAFQWSRQPAADALLRKIVSDFLQNCPAAATLSGRMFTETGTRFFDWIDSFTVPDSFAQNLAQSGFVPHEFGDTAVYQHPEGMFPRVTLSSLPVVTIAIKVDFVADFLAINQLELEIEGSPMGPMRRATLARDPAAQLDIVERRGAWSPTLAQAAPVATSLAIHHLDIFRRRRRDFTDDHQGFAHAMQLARAAVLDLGPDTTCALFFQAEREFWQRRNRAAQVQKARQDQLGLGWANHDHHTYRSSRACFKDLIAFHELLGLECRERFYAGREAGWGAQILENPRVGIITFNDVDLAPEELLEDFAHQPLAPRDALGTVGLWCGLHGEAFLQAGMHHLECQFDFDALKTQLESQHQITVMKPFTDYPHLRQAFTQGERWPVSEDRLQKLLAARLVTAEQAQQFRTQGAIGSHLENLQRNEGYKGFNQKGVSEIIAATDPRKHLQSA